jgi:hypothetical protein
MFDGQFYPFQPIQFMDGLLVPIIGAGVAATPLALTNTDSIVNTANLTTYTFTSRALGAEPAVGETRYIVISTGGNQSAGTTISSVTVAGISAAQVVQSSSVPCGIFIVEVPTGTTGNVVVTFSGGVFGAGIGVYRLIGPSGLAAFATSNVNTHTSGVASGNIDIPSGGACIAVANGIDAGTYTWAALSENFEFDVGSGDNTGGAMSTTPGSPTAWSLTCSDTTPGAISVCLASWGP